MGSCKPCSMAKIYPMQFAHLKFRRLRLAWLCILGVRDVLVALQRAMGRDGGIVLEGRDTGTAIFPDAELKIFLVADPAERARRRLRDLEKRGESAVFESLLEEIRIRDIRDRQTQLQRGAWPASDAICIDTTGLSIAEQVDRIVALARGIKN